MNARSVIIVLCSFTAHIFSQNADWQLSSPPVTTARLNDIWQINEAILYAVGENGTIIASKDGGRNWVKQSTGTSTNLHAVHFIDPNKGWAVGAGGRVLKTIDGGTTWVSQATGVSRSLYSVHFANPDTGWAVGFERTIIKTCDGGLTWLRQYSGAPLTYLEATHFRDSRHGVAVGWGGEANMWKTQDGGNNWTSMKLSNAWMKDVHFIDNMTGWAVGITASYISVSEDVFSGITIDIRDQRSTIWKTVDGGVKWSPIVFTTSQWLHKIAFVDARRGWAIGEAGLILATQDGGTSWQIQSIRSGRTMDLYGIALRDASNGWIVGDQATVLTTNDGLSWHEQPFSGTTNHIQALQFIDSQKGYAVTWQGTMV